MRRVLKHIASEAERPVVVDGFAVLCGDCLAVIVCDTEGEQEAMMLGRAGCPSCGSQECCACEGCISNDVAP